MSDIVNDGSLLIMSEPQENLLFVSQLLIERTLHYSLDSNKARTLNLPSLVIEAIEQIKLVEREGIPDISLRMIVDEISKNLNKNPLALSLIGMPLDKIRIESNADIDQIKRRLNILSGRFSNHAYAKKIFDELTTEFETKGKKELYFFISELITTLVNMGMSASHIHLCTKNFFYKKAQIKKSSFDKLMKIIFPFTHHFKVCLKVSPDSDAAQGVDLSMFGIEFFDKPPEPFIETKSNHEFFKKPENVKFIIIDGIENYDVHSALVEAKKRVLSYINLFRMFDHKVNFQISSEALVDQCCIDGINLIKHNINRMHYVSWQKRDNIRERIGSLASGIRLSRNNDFGKFLRIVDMHGMALSTPIVESQIISLWTSYETIVPGNINKSTIESICRRVLPIIGLNYLARLIHDIYDSSANLAPHEFWKEIDLTGNDVRTELEKFAAVILNKYNHDKLGKALAHLDKYPLLRYKIFQLTQRFCDPKKSISEINTHNERVKWQIRRLYRSRNQIVHTGSLPKFADTLLENGHDYFDQVFLTICELSVGDQGLHTFEQCFDFAELHFEQYLTKINTAEKIDDECAKEMIWKHYHP